MRLDDYQKLGSEILTVTHLAAVGISDSVKKVGFSDARAAKIGPIEGVSVRIYWHGEDPTTSKGHLYGIGDTDFVEGKVSVRKFKAIATEVGPATIPITTFM